MGPRTKITLKRWVDIIIFFIITLGIPYYSGQWVFLFFSWVIAIGVIAYTRDIKDEVEEEN